jgi:hypothetical protein
MYVCNGVGSNFFFFEENVVSPKEKNNKNDIIFSSDPRAPSNIFKQNVNFRQFLFLKIDFFTPF